MTETSTLLTSLAASIHGSAAQLIGAAARLRALVATERAALARLRRRTAAKPTKAESRAAELVARRDAAARRHLPEIPR